MSWLTVAFGFALAAGFIVLTYVLRLLTAPRLPSFTPSLPPSLPDVLVVVPVFNEAALVERKLANLAALRYPAERLRIVVVDGGSPDGTAAIVERAIARGAACTLVRTSLRSKTAQIDEALRRHPSEDWILATDADAILAPDTLRTLVEVACDPAIGVVGTRVRPAAAHTLESLHWRVTDWLRQRECERGSAALVAGPCFLTRRTFIASPPADTIADDVYVAARAMLAGARVGHAPVTVTELRSPRTVRDLLRHKYRKGDAYLREIIRFLPAARRMPPPMREIFLWRAALLTIVPLLAAAAATATALGLRAISVFPQAFATGCAVALVLLCIRPARRAARLAALAAALTAVSTFVLFAYPFRRQSATLPKISQPSDYGLADEVP
jgi:hypothetical protein